jgi:hypothetical protein
MSYPTKYTRQFDYLSYQTANPTRPLPGESRSFRVRPASIAMASKSLKVRGMPFTRISKPSSMPEL